MTEILQPLTSLLNKRSQPGSEELTQTAKLLRHRDSSLRPQSLTRDALYEYAKRLAEKHRSRVSGRRSHALYRNFRYQCRELDRAHRDLGQAAHNKEFITPGAEWLLDNYHIIQQNVADLHRQFPKGYDKTLPKLIDDSSGEAGRVGYPRVYQIAIELLQKSDAVVTPELLDSFIGGYQSVSNLTIGEIWAIPIMLRFALIENISLLAGRFQLVREERLEADQFIDRIMGDEMLAGTQILLVLAGRINEKPDFLAKEAPYLIRRLRERGRKASLTLQWLEERIREEGVEPEDILRNEQYGLAADQISIGNSINSLRTVDHVDWKAWFESVSKVEAILKTDPAGLYHLSDFLTRNNCRARVEKMARRLGREEPEIAQTVVDLAASRRAELLKDEQLTAQAAATKTGSSNFQINLTKQSHVGFYLLDKGLRDFERKIGFRSNPLRAAGRFILRHPFWFYSGGILALTLIIILNILHDAIHARSASPELILLGLLLFVPASDLATNVAQWLVTRLLPPDVLPKLDFSKGLPEHARCCVVVHALFNDKDSILKTVEGLEVRYLANPDPQLVFGILSDLHDADEPVLPTDRELMEFARNKVDELRARYEGGQFFILFRERLWNPSQGRFMCWERKRGKLEEFNRLLLGKGKTTFIIPEREQEFISSEINHDKIKYVITLDNDSQLPRGSAAKLLGTIAHPLNTPVFHPKTRRVVSGYAIIQPRMGITLSSAYASRFAEIFSGHAGLDPYTMTVSEAYQDLFHEGSYIGKGVYNVEPFFRSLEGRVPENALLSHDLFEGLFARAGLATDVELFDDFPSKYHVHARRHHRWVRGDWQLLHWLWPIVPNSKREYYRNPISALGRWKLFDNLRRSLVAPTTFFLLCFAWAFVPVTAGYWTIFALLIIAFPVYANVAQAFLIPPRGVSYTSHVRGVGRDMLMMSKQAIFTLCLLPHQTLLMLDAVFRTIYRMFISKKQLLDWESAYYAERRLHASYGSFVREMWPCLLLTTLALVNCLVFNPKSLVYNSPIFLLWLASPIIAKRLSDPIRYGSPQMRSEDQEYVFRTAWRIWRYFRELLTEENHYLVPDNIQLVPERRVAQRTSPTNISLSILSTISAYDLGFYPLPAVLERLNKIYSTLQQLEKFRGHFLNWYNSLTLEPLPPKYVSFVDSGNLVGHFIAVRSALSEFESAPLIGPRHLQHIQRICRSILAAKPGFGPDLNDGAQKLLEQAGTPPQTFKQWAILLRSVHSFSETLLQRSTTTGAEEPDIEVGKLGRDLNDLSEVLEVIDWAAELPDESPLIKPDEASPANPAAEAIHKLHHLFNSGAITLETLRPLLAGILAHRADLLGSAEVTNQQFDRAVAQLGEMDGELWSLETATQTLISGIDFRFLYDEDRALFTIGYHVDSARRDQSFYDMLASEARLGSIAAIAFGQVPQQHWFALGRPLADSPGGKVLLSWSGTMFEYMMPLLMTKDFPGTLLSETYRGVIRAQKAYGSRRGVPWGISESSYGGVDFERTYQYRAFGVPGLGLKRGLDEDLVISPYSTLLCLTIAYDESLGNLRALEREGLWGEYGFYEAADYTPSRLTANEKKHVVQSFFAHHQGMSLVMINNLLSDGIFQRRFHIDPEIKATELLLHEKFPDRVPTITPYLEEPSLSGGEEQEDASINVQILGTAHTAYPRTHLLSNSRYAVMLDNSGSGYSNFERELMITRWREDGAINQEGNYIYIRDLDSGAVWSATYQPTLIEPESYQVVFSPDKAEFQRRDYNIFTHSEITVSPEDNVEIRRIVFTNLSDQKRVLEITSFGEVALNTARADAAHPAFSKMFIESWFDSDLDTLFFSRRPRSRNERRPYFFHSVSMRVVWDRVQYDSSRYSFIGRGRSVYSPGAIAAGLPLAGNTGYVLDPVYALRVKLEIEPGQTESVNFVSGFSYDKEEITHLAGRYRDLHQVARAFEMAWSQASVELRSEHGSARHTQTIQRLGNLLLFNVDRFRAKPDVITRNRLGQQNLWRFGISGDLPIVVVQITEPDQTKLVQELLHAHHYLRNRGLIFDLIILNEYPGGYLQNLQEEIEFLIRASLSAGLAEKKGGIFLRNLQQISEEERDLLLCVARAVFLGHQGSLNSQLKFEELEARSIVGRRLRLLEKPPTERPAAPTAPEREFFNGYGGFIDHGKGYWVQVSDSMPPAPWSNVIATDNFGCLVTDTGGGYTWSDNSRENRLTPWTNDPVSDPMGEALYIRDSDTGQAWCPTPRPMRPFAAVQVEHRFGATTFITTTRGIESRMTVTISPEEKIKWWQLDLRNTARTRRKLELFLYIEWVLGVSRDDTGRYIVTGFDANTNCLTAVNRFNQDFPGRMAFAGSSHEIAGYTAQRYEFIGRNRDLAHPIVFDLPAGSRTAPPEPVRLSKKIGAGFDQCGVLKVSAIIEPGARESVLFYLGEAQSVEQQRKIAVQSGLFQTYDSHRRTMNEKLKPFTDAITVRTPERSFDVLLNGWLPYQVLTSRFFGRTGFYQSGGAVGFRDQLQDVLAFLYFAPELARKQLLLHAAHQFPEGDVQHWWHPPTSKGVRTKITDDFLWLPYVAAKYIEATGDNGVFDVEAPFVEAPLLGEHDHETYIVPRISDRRATLYQHCILALDYGLRFGPHGLPIIGTGDWNDGMNEVGKDGKGESVWLGWFLINLLRTFAPICESRGEAERAAKYRGHADAILAAIEEHAWDGEWYVRAFFDDGTPLGSHVNDECQIDSLPQSWSVITGGGSTERARSGLTKVHERLVDDKARIISLLKPAFDKGSTYPGYIKGYLPGIRENGGQYTHAAAWVTIATAQLGDGNKAFELFQMINPVTHSSSPESVNRYQTEPYVLCGDVYSVAPHIGRGGWSWYTGSASWMYQAGISHILGLKVHPDCLTITPCIPTHWKEYKISYHRGEATYVITVHNPNGKSTGVERIKLGGSELADKRVPFAADHKGVIAVDVEM